MAQQLEILDTHVFYDEYFESNFLGKTWSQQFKRIFAEDSRLVVCLLDKHHNEKIWPTFERECFQPRIADEAVIPIFLDETIFVGIPQDLIGIKFHWDNTDSKWKDQAVEDILMKLIDRVG